MSKKTLEEEKLNDVNGGTFKTLKFENIGSKICPKCGSFYQGVLYPGLRCPGCNTVLIPPLEAKVKKRDC